MNHTPDVAAAMVAEVESAAPGWRCRFLPASGQYLAFRPAEEHHREVRALAGVAPEAARYLPRPVVHGDSAREVLEQIAAHQRMWEVVREQYGVSAEVPHA